MGRVCWRDWCRNCDKICCRWLTNCFARGNIYRQSARRTQKNMGVFPSGQWGQTVNLLLFSFGGSNPPAPTKNSSVVMTLEFLFYPEVCKASQGWIRTAAEPTTACGGNREARLGQRSDFSRPRQGVAEKSASATRKARRFASRRAKTAAARKAPCGGCSHFVESSGKITSRTRRCTRSRTLPAAS